MKKYEYTTRPMWANREVIARGPDGMPSNWSARPLSNDEFIALLNEMGKCGWQYVEERDGQAVFEMAEEMT
jgi:hypothetical protein